ncbi:MAG: antitoxin [bacterium]
MAIDDRSKITRIAAEIREELKKLDWLYAEWRGVDTDLETSSLILRGKGSIFHDFYCGVERIFRRIADDLNGGIPAGDSWHRDLLVDMKLDLPGLRPAVITEETFRVLADFLDFRHKFRNIYGFELDFEKLKVIEEKFSPAFEKIKTDISTFLRFLDNFSALPSPR